MRLANRWAVPGKDVLTLVYGDDDFYQPNASINNALNLRVLLTSFPRVRGERRWLTQVVHDPYAAYIVGPWQWDEFAITSFVLFVDLFYVFHLLT